jgi:putative ABC transport system permease protein
MQWLAEFWRRLLFLFRRQQFDSDLEEEMRFHLEMQAAESGLMAARKKFGNAALLQEESREAWGWAGVETWAADLKYAARALRKNLAFTTVAVLTVALGIGASTAVFSVVNAVLLRPLPFRAPDRLMMVWETREKLGEFDAVVSYPNFNGWREQSRSFQRMAAFIGDGVRTSVGGEPVIVNGSRVSHDFFMVLGVQPMLGRTFMPDEENASAKTVTVLSYAFWQRLGGDRNLVGKKVQFDREVFTVVGIMPRGFAFPADAEMWFPILINDPRNIEIGHSFRVIARLKDGATPAVAQREMQTIAARLKRAYPQDKEGIGANVVPLLEQTVGEARRALLVLMGAVGCVLLIAGANVANLLLVRTTSRRRELALRLSLGAGRWRIARCLLSESVLLALGGGALGVAAAYWLVRAFVALDPIHLPRIQEVSINGSVLLYALAAAIATGLLFGLAPALGASRPNLGNWLKEGPGASGVNEFRKNRARSLLASAQIALAVTLLIGAGLLLRSFVMRLSVPLGFQPEGVLAVDLPNYVAPHVDDLLERLRALPGVKAVGAATAFPQNAAGSSCSSCLEIKGQPRRDGKDGETGIMVATPGFLRAAGMIMQRGRFLTAADGKDAPPVAVINQALARRDFPDEDPIGRSVRRGTSGWATVIGVAGNTKGFGVAGDQMPEVYFANGQTRWGNGVEVLVRTAVPPLSLASAVRKEMRSWNKRMIIGEVNTLDHMLAESVAVPRFYLLLVVAFAVMALLVSAVGLYGTVNYSVARRTHEIGIRMALGAQRGDVLGMIFGQGLGLIAFGLALGLAGAWVSTRLLQTLLFGVQPDDATAFICGSAVLVVAVLLACYIPARRATRVDPLVALRHE